MRKIFEKGAFLINEYQHSDVIKSYDYDFLLFMISEYKTVTLDETLNK